jgi:hypothetical protein
LYGLNEQREFGTIHAPKDGTATLWDIKSEDSRYDGIDISTVLRVAMLVVLGE